MKKVRVTFYVDGFNFYYGLKGKKKADPCWAQFYWIDIVKLFSQFIGDGQELAKVVYFTASPLDQDASSRQSALLNANTILSPGVFEVVRGKYINKTITCPNCKYAINRPEEKKTDVNLSIRMIEDCLKDKTDIAVLVSADTDLIPPVDFIMRHFPSKKVRVYFPPSRHSYELQSYMHGHKSNIVNLEFNFKKFVNSIMPDVVSVGDKSYTIPEKWRNNKYYISKTY